jgi:hypothetical protein
MLAVKQTRFFNSHASEHFEAVNLATSAVLIYGVGLIGRRLLLYLAAHNYPQRFNTKTRPQTMNTFQLFHKNQTRMYALPFVLCAAFIPPMSANRTFP